ncbi:sensor histidine kinase [Deefgea salmonis]|uniref:histidine kinase n=1 Tax=Deefgea salmonis TaxID=2875502 RepID=A0ABS8BM26_9NEIS|nr:HAMP domain-containing sensor histidine kinase [Deefgea salmonis]MCB5196581.1 HAMP domain-containing histidine kinase [Deefgea salmonis]
MRQETKQQFKKLEWSAILALLCAVLAAIFVYLSYVTLAERQAATERRYQSYLLAEQMRLSSDQLTLMARAYAATGNTKFLQFYNQILDIRNGIRPRPENYHRVYWDLLMPHQGVPPFPDGQTVSLRQLFDQNGFTEQELLQLHAAQASSDQLADLEKNVFKLVAQNKPKTDGNYVTPAAVSQLYGEAYLQAKSQIMSRVNEFYHLQEARNAASVAHAVNKNNLMISFAILSFIGLVISSLFNFRVRAQFADQFIGDLQNEVTEQTNIIIEKNQELTHAFDLMAKAQKNLIETEKMASLGALVVGVAHEINTPVGICITATSYMEEENNELSKMVSDQSLKKKSLENYLEKFDQSIKLSLKNLHRIASIINNFKEVAVDQDVDVFSSIDLKEDIQYMVDEVMLSNQYNQNQITIYVHCDEQWICLCYPGVLIKVLRQLLKNALIHAFDAGANGQIDVVVAKIEHYYQISVQDNGKGMQELEQLKIFDPFYTTKRNQGGIGLGLPIVFNLVTQKLGGSIRCTSVVGQGTCFQIKIPVEGKSVDLT